MAVPATVEADPANVVAVVTPLTGRLLALKVGLGDTVRRGQVVAVIASPDFGQAQADAAKAADGLESSPIARWRGRAACWARARTRRRTSSRRKARSARRWPRTSARASGSRRSPAARASTRRRPAWQGAAPAAGVVTALTVGSGAYLNDATAPLMTISGLGHVWVTAQVPEQQLPGIVAGAPVDVTLAAWPGQALHGRVARVSPLVEPDTHRVKVRIAFDNADGRLKPNMFAIATFAVAQQSAITVPASALLMNNDSTTVLVEVAPWTFVRRVVELGSEDGDVVRVTSGLQRGDRVVTRGGVLLND